MTNRFYSGIGSRQTPKLYLNYIELIAATLANAGWILRSGGADGADMAFEQGCDSVGGKKEIFLPWKKFNGNLSPLCKPSKEAHELASTIHPVWDQLSYGAKLLHARNCHQVLGTDLNEPVSLVVCWTFKGNVSGGTATAINLAKAHNIPVYNLEVDGFDVGEYLDDPIYQGHS